MVNRGVRHHALRDHPVPAHYRSVPGGEREGAVILKMYALLSARHPKEPGQLRLLFLVQLQFTSACPTERLPIWTSMGAGFGLCASATDHRP